MRFADLTFAAHQNDVENFSHVSRVLSTGEKLVNEPGAASFSRHRGELRQLALRRYPADQIQIKSPRKRRIRSNRRMLYFALFPTLLDEAINCGRRVHFACPRRHVQWLAGGVKR